MDALLNSLERVERRHQEINDQLIDPSTFNDRKLFASLGKEQASLQKILVPYTRLKEVLEHLSQAREALELDDAELAEMAQMEVDELEAEEAELREKLEVLLIPKDPADDKNAIVEIRGAAGGDEGNIFAGDLFRMYTRYAEQNGYKIEILESSESEAGGYSLISFIIKGSEDPYGHMKFESGAHRVQRVPKTETQGRVHTSTATVLVLPEIEEDDYELNPDDLTIETHRATGAGGQHVNKTDSAVRITHKPTGISVNCQDGRSQHDNRATAMQLIRSRVYEEMERRKQEEEGAIRKAKLGTGDRSEKIRTYNYPQNRVSDHRIGLTITQLDRIMDGKLNDVIEALIEFDQKEKLAQS
ncbi:MAG TPA: peptide chain release factor 1 [Erysipelothrix sp.]|nr:peptide chain release factor 1 [Erysipelothrix sp.]